MSNSDQIYFDEHDGYKNLKEKLIDWSAFSTMHGIPRMFGRTHFTIKLTWLLFVILSWTVCFYFVIKMILQYLQNDFNVNVEIIAERPTRFPAIDICNLSPYDGDAIELIKYNLTFEPKSSMPDYPHMDDSNTDWYKYKVYQSQFADNKRKKEFDDILALKYVKIKADSLIRSKLNEFENEASEGKLNLSEIGFQMKDMLLSCKFQGRYCSVNDFTQYHNYYYGNCFRFNGGQNIFNQKISYKKITKPGWRYGFQLELFTGRNGILALRNGFRILINNQTELIQAFPEEDGIDVSPGFVTHIAIEKTLVERLPSPFNDCMDNLIDSKFDYLIKKSETIQVMKNVLNMTKYDQKLCLKMCLQQFIMDNCNCTDFTLPKYLLNQTNTGCRSLNELICSSYSEGEFFYTNSISQCVQNCPEKCTFTRYNTKISSSKYPNHWFVKNQNISISQEEYNNFVALVNIFYDDMLYTKISQSPLVSREVLFGNLGGTFGIFFLNYFY